MVDAMLIFSCLSYLMMLGDSYIGVDQEYNVDLTIGAPQEKGDEMSDDE
jgi:hypothetical protein